MRKNYVLSECNLVRLAKYIFLKRAREEFQTKFHQESTIQSTTTIL